MLQLSDSWIRNPRRSLLSLQGSKLTIQELVLLSHLPVRLISLLSLCLSLLLKGLQLLLKCSNSWINRGRWLLNSRGCRLLSIGQCLRLCWDGRRTAWNATKDWGWLNSRRATRDAEGLCLR